MKKNFKCQSLNGFILYDNNTTCQSIPCDIIMSWTDTDYAKIYKN